MYCCCSRCCCCRRHRVLFFFHSNIHCCHHVHITDRIYINKGRVEQLFSIFSHTNTHTHTRALECLNDIQYLNGRTNFQIVSITEQTHILVGWESKFQNSELKFLEIKKKVIAIDRTWPNESMLSCSINWEKAKKNMRP